MTDLLQSPLSGYLAKLEIRRSLFSEERAALLSLPSRLRRFDAQSVVVEEGDEANRCLFIVDGEISRQKQVGDSRQILAVGFPGDAVDLQTLFFEKTDHTLFTHSVTTLASVAHADIIELCDRHPDVAKTLWHDSLVDCAIFREWIVNVGHRRARARIGHLFLEFEARLGAIGQSRDGIFQVPFTQGELADALGLSLVHFNKSFRVLREAGWITFRGGLVTIIDREALSHFSGFDPAYLHLKSSFKLRKALDGLVSEPT